MAYRIVLTKNGEYKKTLYKCQKEENALINYKVIKKMNENIMFPRKFINYNGISSVYYQIMLVKDIEVGDTNRFVRDHMGKLYEEKPLNGVWTILNSSEYNFEETFWVFGHDPKHNRLTIHDIIKKLMTGIHNQRMVKQVLIIHNKLIIRSDEQFEMVICKNKIDAQRLHDVLLFAARNNGLKNLLFMGNASPATIGLMYEIIHEKTKWPMTKIRRTSTRP